MTRALEEAFELASALPEQEQDALARWLKEEIEGERRWTALFEQNGAALDALVREAREDFRAGRTTHLLPGSPSLSAP